MGDATFACEPHHDFSPEDLNNLEVELYRHNAEHTGYDDGKGLGFVIRRADGLAGAVAGYSWGGICELRQLWVREDQRGNGVGRALVQAAIAEARRRGCAKLFVSTYDFQAPNFYRKLGFDLVAEIPDKPLGHTEFILMRSLSA